VPPVGASHVRPAGTRRRAALIVVLLAALGVVGLSACGGGTSQSGGGSAPTSPKFIKVTFSGESVTPNGERVDVSTGQPIQLEVTADRPGEIHVHSSPEQQLSYGKGTSTVIVKPIEAPGEVDVESHALDKVIVQLEVR
jgi:hypothetical protein